MGADLFIVAFGVRHVVDGDDEEAIEALELRTDYRFKAARSNKLKVWWGFSGDGGPAHVIVGDIIGKFGIEADYHAVISTGELAERAASVVENLKAAGFEEEPLLHFQFEADF